jgi:hypothetical protein
LIAKASILLASFVWLTAAICAAMPAKAFHFDLSEISQSFIGDNIAGFLLIIFVIEICLGLTLLADDGLRWLTQNHIYLGSVIFLCLLYCAAALLLPHYNPEFVASRPLLTASLAWLFIVAARAITYIKPQKLIAVNPELPPE